MIILHDLAKRLAAVLGREGNNRGGAAKYGGYGRRVKIIRHHDAGGRFLFDVAVALHAARQDKLATSIDRALRGTEPMAEGDDFAVFNRYIALHAILSGDHGSITNDRVILGHGCFLLTALQQLGIRRVNGRITSRHRFQDGRPGSPS